MIYSERNGKSYVFFLYFVRITMSKRTTAKRRYLRAVDRATENYRESEKIDQFVHKLLTPEDEAGKPLQRKGRRGANDHRKMRQELHAGELTPLQALCVKLAGDKPAKRIRAVKPHSGHYRKAYYPTERLSVWYAPKGLAAPRMNGYRWSQSMFAWVKLVS